MRKLRNPGILAFLALIFIIFGILISSNFNITISKKEAFSEKAFSEGSSVFDSGESPFAKVAEMVSPSVVNISAEKVVERSSGYIPFDEFYRRFFGEEPPEKSVPQEKYRTSSLGSGFVIREDGYILTNNHVVSGADKIWVKLSDGSEYKAELLGQDQETDIAVLKIEPEGDLPVVTLGNSDSIKVGDWAVAIGNPFPQLGLDRTVTVGVISAVGRGNLYFGEEMTPSYQNYIQTDASINPGNSGGPLVNIGGEVIGINSAITNPTGMRFNIGIGFAIPVNLAKSVLPDLMAGRSVTRGYLGIYIGNVTNDLAEALDLSSTDGIIVNQVQEGTPAEGAGLLRGDVVIEFNGKKVENVQQFMFMVAKTSPDTEVELKIIRDGKEKILRSRLGSKSDFVAQAEPEKKEQKGKWLGLTVNTSTKQLAAQYKVKWAPGVLVVSVEPGSAADKKGIREGDIIMEIDQSEVENLSDYERIIDSLKDRGKAIPFLISRNGNTIFLAIKP